MPQQSELSDDDFTDPWRSAPAMLLQHGFSRNGRFWYNWVPLLSREFRTLRPDGRGMGRSTLPEERYEASLDVFASDVRRSLDHLGIEQAVLVGKSFGGIIGLKFAHAYPERTRALLEFYKRHLCRLEPWPEPLLRSGRNIEGNAVDETMNSPNEFTVIGNLKDWDRIDRLGEITVPTLITVGRYDEITPACAETMHRGIPHSQVRVFEQSSHTAHLEETETYLQVVADFLQHVDERRRENSIRPA